jgi:hypothetical protein
MSSLVVVIGDDELRTVVTSVTFFLAYSSRSVRGRAFHSVMLMVDCHYS